MATVASRTSDPRLETEAGIANVQWQRYVRARDNGHLKYVDEAFMYDQFYNGEQWKEADKQKLLAECRPALTINMILSTVNAAIGEHISKRAEIYFKPKRNATEDTATILNRLHKTVQDDNKYDSVETQVFSDGLIQDRGYYDVRLDFSTNLQGEVRITAEDPLDIVLDPDAKEYDPRTWNEVFKSRWISVDDVENLFGKKKADQVRAVALSARHFGPDSVTIRRNRYGRYNDYDPRDGALPEREVRAIRAVRIIERQYYVLAPMNFFVDKYTGDMKEVPIHWDDDRAMDFARKLDLFIVQRTVKRVRWTVTCDHVVLHDDWSPYRQFTIVPFFPYFRRGKPFGLVRNLISPQEMLNKASSQELHVINTSANSGWKVPAGSLTNMDINDLEKRGAETGLIIEYNPGIGAPEKIQANDIPAGLDHVSAKAQANIKAISGINEGMLGQVSNFSRVSGEALKATESRVQVQLQSVFDNLALSRQIVAEACLNLYQNFYTEERTFYVANDMLGAQPNTPEFQQLTINQKTATGELINNITIGDYGVVVSTKPAQDAFNDTQFEEAARLRELNVQIPDDAMVEFSNLAHKRELAARMRNQISPEQRQKEQMLAELQMETMRKQMSKLDAEIQRANTGSDLNRANAEKARLEKERLQLQERLKEMEVLMKAVDNETKRDLADLSADVDMELGELNSATAIETARINVSGRNQQRPSSR